MTLLAYTLQRRQKFAEAKQLHEQVLYFYQICLPECSNHIYIIFYDLYSLYKEQEDSVELENLRQMIVKKLNESTEGYLSGLETLSDTLLEGDIEPSEYIEFIKGEPPVTSTEMCPTRDHAEDLPEIQCLGAEAPDH